MSSNIEEAVVERLRALPPQQQQQVLDFVEGLTPASDPSQSEPTKTIWDKIEERIAQAPPDAWDDVPPDGSTNADHYLYGAPKK